MRKAARAGSILSNLLQDNGYAQKLREHRAWQIWDKVVGPQIAQHARPLRIREGVLEVRVDQPIWMQQLRLMAPQILGKLNRALGEELIREIFWRQGRLNAAPTADQRDTPAMELPVLTSEEVARTEAATARLQDPEIRRALSSLLQWQARVDKARRDKSLDPS